MKPRYRRLRVSKKYKPALEPLYRKGIGRVPPLNQHTCYRGDDYGGHNIPFPIPEPPKPDRYYDDSFVDLGAYYGFVNYGPKEARYYDHSQLAKVDVFKDSYQPEIIYRIEAPRLMKP